MGLRFRKSINLGKGVRINFSKSGVGWSVGTKGARFTKKATGGYRTTASIVGTGISYTEDFGGKGRKTKTADYSSTRDVATKPRVNYYDETQDLTNPVKSVIGIALLLSLWMLCFIPMIIGFYNLSYFCQDLNKFRKNNAPKCDKHIQFCILNENTTHNIRVIVLSLCFWFLVLPLLSAIKKLKILHEEFLILKEKEDEALLGLQRILVINSGDQLLFSRQRLHRMAHDFVSNNMRIIKDSQAIVENTKDMETFFMRLNLILEKYKEITLLEPYIYFYGNSPYEAYKNAIVECEKQTMHFIYQYIANLIEKAEMLKTEKGKFSRYQKAYDAFRSHYDTISHENQERIETAFSKLLIL